MFDEVFDKVVAFALKNTTTKCHHQSGGGINQQTTAIGCKMRDERWEMGNGRREGARAKTTNVEFYTIILSFLIMTISSRQHCRLGAGKKGVTFDTCCTITQRSRLIPGIYF